MPVLAVSFYTVPVGNCITGSPAASRIFEVRFYFIDWSQTLEGSYFISAQVAGTSPLRSEGTGCCILLQLTVLCVTRRVQRGLEAIHGFHVRGRGRRGRLRRRGVLPQMQGGHDARRNLQVRGRDPTRAVQPLRRRPLVPKASW